MTFQNKPRRLTQTALALMLTLVMTLAVFVLSSCAKTAPPEAAKYVREYKNSYSVTVQEIYIFDGKGNYTFIGENGATTKGGYYVADGVMYITPTGGENVYELVYKRKGDKLTIDGFDYIKTDK